MLVIASLLNHAVFLYPSIVALWWTVMLPPLLWSRILLLALLMLWTSFGLQNRSIVDWLSNRMIFLRSSEISLPCFCLNRTSAFRFSNAWWSIVPFSSGTPGLPCGAVFLRRTLWNWKWEASSSSLSESVRLSSSSSSILLWSVANDFFIFFCIFVMLALLDLLYPAAIQSIKTNFGFFDSIHSHNGF